MDETGAHTTPEFLEGAEVASARRRRQPGFAEQLPLLEQDLELKKKLTVAVTVIASVFLGGLVAGAVLGYFV
jgi:hypothetical protein